MAFTDTIPHDGDTEIDLLSKILTQAGAQHDPYLGIVASQVEMLALTGIEGDFCIRSDTTPANTVWMLTGGDPTLLASWTEMPIIPPPVTSVNGRIGAVTVPLSPDNKKMVAEATANDGDEACATGITTTPKGYVVVVVNGALQDVGDGVKTSSCYFSGDGGTTARAIAAIVSGDKLYWNGSAAGYQLQITDTVDFNYAI